MLACRNKVVDVGIARTKSKVATIFEQSKEGEQAGRNRDMEDNDCCELAYFGVCLMGHGVGRGNAVPGVMKQATTKRSEDPRPVG